MKIKHYLIAVILCASAAVSAQSVWNAEHLAEVRKHLQKPYYATAYEALKAQADSMLDAKPLSVMQKEKLPASGDRHDYLSQARYFGPTLRNLTDCLTSTATACRIPNWRNWTATVWGRQLNV